MDTPVKVTYVGSSGRRRARGKTESYWFMRGSSQHIPASDVEAVTSHDPENWVVDWPKSTPPDTLRRDWPAAPAQASPRRRRHERQGAANTKTEPPSKDAPVNEE